MCKIIPDLKNEYLSLSEVDSCSIRCSVFDLDNAFDIYYKNLGWLPKYKK